jgi:hypothetical protein
MGGGGNRGNGLKLPGMPSGGAKREKWRVRGRESGIETAKEEGDGWGDRQARQ